MADIYGLTKNQIDRLGRALHKVESQPGLIIGSRSRPRNSIITARMDDHMKMGESGVTAIVVVQSSLGTWEDTTDEIEVSAGFNRGFWVKGEIYRFIFEGAWYPIADGQLSVAGKLDTTGSVGMERDEQGTVAVITVWYRDPSDDTYKSTGKNLSIHDLSAIPASVTITDDTTVFAQYIGAENHWVITGYDCDLGA